MDRGWLIGVDEAGYGPNLGPLVIGVTAWPVDADAGLGGVDLYDRLAGAVSREPTPGRIAVGDSKRLYKPGGGLAALEAATLAPLTPTPRRWSDLVERLGADPDDRRRALAWHRAFDPELPLAAEPAAWADAAERLPPPRVAARLVFPEEFNAAVERWGSKGAALSHATLALLAGVLDPAAPTVCVCDKHGGRNRYAALLERHVGGASIETLAESRAESRYRVGRAEIAFRAGGEAFLPTAWASMTAKYLREVAMRALNAFWAGEVADLKPTAGYPVDAKRFKAAIAARQRELGIDDRVLWRAR